MGAGGWRHSDREACLQRWMTTSNCKGTKSWLLQKLFYPYILVPIAHLASIRLFFYGIGIIFYDFPAERFSIYKDGNPERVMD